MKSLHLILPALLCINPVFAQKKLLSKLFSNEKDTVRRASYIPIPVFGYAQETGFEFGVGSIYSFYIDKTDLHNRSSNLTGSASYSTKGSYNVKLSSDLWTKQNKYHILNEIRFKDLPFNFYGIGNQTLHNDEDKLKQRLIKFSVDVEKKVANHTYTGISLGFEKYHFKDLIAGGIFHTQPLTGKSGGSVLYLGLSQGYDTRNSNNYPTKGFFGRISYQYAPNIFGNTNFTGSQIKVNLRSFWSLTPMLTLGVQGLYYTIQGKNNTPFYLLQQFGNDEMMRGYYTGRYREENLIAAQTELRFRFVERLGIVAFAGTGKVFSNGSDILKNLKPNYGVGGRFFFDPAKGLSLRADYGFGEKLPGEKRQSGFYISFAEAF